MYSNKMVATVRHNGKVLREHDDMVMLPFGAEYEIHLTNLNTVRAMVTIKVDGQDVTDGVSLVIEPSGTVSLERFLKADNLQQGHRLKFIERTEKIEQGPRGIKPEDGLLQVTFEYEVARLTQPIVAQPATDPYRNPWRGTSPSTGDPWTHPQPREIWCSTSVMRGQKATSEPDTFTTMAATGITVPGSISDQRFHTASPFLSNGVTHTMVLRLVGEVDGQPVTKALTTRTKVECPTCGTKNRSSHKWCPECGTNLVNL